MLSKSRFLSGVQCQKKLFFDVHRRDLKAQVSKQQQRLFDIGNRLGLLAHQLFPFGVNAADSINGKWSIAIQRTLDYLRHDVQTIFEASFGIQNGFAALDILHRENSEISAIEVKSSTSVKPYHITDASYQYFIMRQSGYPPDKFFLMYINNQYVKNGNINPHEFFKIEDITNQVFDKQDYVIQKQEELIEILQVNKEPLMDIGKHCYNPFTCDYISTCWSHLPETNNVFELYNARGKDWDLYNKGIFSLSDVPDNYPLTDFQELQIQGVKNNQHYIDKDKIAEFLSSVMGPLYFFDFETINPALPVLNGTRPFEQVPFQYSLHITDMHGTIKKHCAFLADYQDFNSDVSADPRLKLIQQLKKDIGPEGSIIAYNASFEITRLKELSLAFPKEAEFIESLMLRFVDLLKPFQSGWFYKPEMGSSASIKSVLPSIDPSFSYNDLDISNGGVASSSYHELIENCYIDNHDILIKNLLKYCERDTEGMVVIYRYLKQIVH